MHSKKTPYEQVSKRAHTMKIFPSLYLSSLVTCSIALLWIGIAGNELFRQFLFSELFPRKHGFYPVCRLCYKAARIFPPACFKVEPVRQPNLSCFLSCFQPWVSLITTRNILHIPSNLYVSKAPDPNDIPPIVLKSILEYSATYNATFLFPLPVKILFLLQRIT